MNQEAFEGLRETFEAPPLNAAVASQALGKTALVFCPINNWS